ncbi:MAG: YicC family protein [Proteobacteria bacterium]|nr:YicC family protein [Pseudomonadota bacterium]
MIHSMTAYGRAEHSGNWSEASCEIRTVNHRYLDISIRLPEELRLLEQLIRERISDRLNRGKIDCSIRFEQREISNGALPVNQDLLAKIIKTAEKTSSQLKMAAPLNPLDLLRWPGVLDKDVLDTEAITAPLLELVDRTLDAVIDTRQREGKKIRMMIRERCQSAKINVSRVRELMPAILDSIREKLTLRAQELSNEFDNERLEQELLLLAQKMDVAEEMDRLDAHIDEVTRVLDQNGPVGRRLDFLMQEMNRESNTLGSKSSHLDTSNVSVDLKVLIEQMREQIQNIE